MPRSVITWFLVSGTTCRHARPVKDQSQKRMSAFPTLVSAMVPTCRSASALFRSLSSRRLLILETHDQAQVSACNKDKQKYNCEIEVEKSNLFIFFLYKKRDNNREVICWKKLSKYSRLLNPSTNDHDLDIYYKGHSPEYFPIDILAVARR